MKIGVLINSYRCALGEAISKAAEAGADGVQFYANADVIDEPQKMAELKQVADDCGVTISALVAELGGHGFQIAAENPAKLERMKTVFDVAGKLGAVVTGHIGTVPQDENSADYAVMVDAMNSLGQSARNAGTVFGIETGPETPEALLNLLHHTQGGVGVNLDPANLMMVQGCNAVHAVEVLHEHIVYTHAKDGVHYRDCDAVRVYDAFARGGFEQLQSETGKLFAETPLGEGAVYFPAYLAALRRYGYDGYLTIERETGDDPQKDITLAVEFLKKQLEMQKTITY
ncbi:MAG: sugar phosphate isomerase/epimerase [Lentisphaeria bacterium]|nr:sugar phosphate isomerase/epimerase [Lentisphaeria bacterium]